MTPAQAIAPQPQVADPAPRTQFGEAVLPARSLKGLTVAALVDHDSLWICASKDGGGFAIRAAFCPAGELALVEASDESAWTIDVATSAGPIRCQVSFDEALHATIHLSSRFVPSRPVQLDAWPRDLVAYGPSRDPLTTTGVVHTKQRGLRTGVVYGSMTAPVEMTFLYLQDFSSLGDLLSDSKSSPADSVGGDWPLLGYAPAAGGPLDAAKEYVIADTYLILTDGAAIDDVSQAQTYLDLMANAYTALPERQPRWHDWPQQALAVLRDLTFSPDCSEERDGERYLLPYVGDRTKPPESMVQLAVLMAMREYGQWSGSRPRLAPELLHSLPTFLDPEVGCVVRWLPGASFGEQSEEIQSAAAMDSWYLYHVLFNLSRLAKADVPVGRKLFLGSLPYAIKVARRFGYRWPVFFDVQTLDVIRAESAPGQGGEHDVAGFYALVMLQAFELTGDETYLEEAKRAAETLANLGFSLGYQMNTTAFAGQAMLGLFKLTKERRYLGLFDVCIANLVDNLWLWDCKYGNGASQATFFGAFPLHDAPYLAAYEEAELVGTIHDLLNEGRQEIRGSVRLLLGEYLRFAQDRMWAYLPSHQAPEAVAKASRVGRLELGLAIPLEDLTDGWEQSGQVGQQIYGAAFASVAATRHFRPLPKTDLLFCCDYPVLDFEYSGTGGGGRASFRLGGERRGTATARYIPRNPDGSRIQVTCSDEHGRPIPVRETPEGHHLVQLRGDRAVRFAWKR